MHRKIRDFPAFGQVRRKCNKSNHFASVCNAKQSNSVNVVLNDDNSDLSVLQVETVSTLASKGKQVITELIFCIEDADRVKYKKSVVCQLDTGASCNLISYRDSRPLNSFTERDAQSRKEFSQTQEVRWLNHAAHWRNSFESETQ